MQGLCPNSTSLANAYRQKTLTAKAVQKFLHNNKTPCILRVKVRVPYHYKECKEGFYAMFDTVAMTPWHPLRSSGNAKILSRSRISRCIGATTYLCLDMRFSSPNPIDNSDGDPILRARIEISSGHPPSQSNTMRPNPREVEF